MSEQKPTRLAKAATYFNVGREEIIEFLNSKGFTIDANPNAKIEDAMFHALNEKFQSEHELKEEINQSNANYQKSKEQKIETIATPEVVQKIEEPIAEIIEAPKQEIVVEVPIIAETAIAETEEKNQKIETVAPKLGGLKVVKNVDLDEIKKSTSTKKKEKVEPKIEKVESVEPINTIENTVEEVKIAPETSNIEIPTIVPETTPVDSIQTTPPVIEEDTTEHIKTNFQKLEGAKVLGTINLDEYNKKKDEKKEDDAKKKRLRISGDPKVNVDKKRVVFDNADKDKAKFTFNKKAKTTTNTTKTGVKPVDNTPQVVSDKEIEENIKRTEAKINGPSNKNQRSKLRKKKRDDHAEKAMLNAELENDKMLKLTEFITVSEMGSLMNMSPTAIISFCFSMGLIVSINQRLDAEIIELIASEFDFEVEFISLEDSNQFVDEIDDPADLKERAPIVTIMGHVDHGKTSLLDYIRQANVAKKEAGGITQHIGAYDVLVPKLNRKITFIDTPGHEAFTAMRARGAKLTDISVIVIAADDKVMPQTREAISHSQSANVPMIFAINKIDKTGANPDGVRSQLSEMNLLVESWGGKYQEHEISAKTGTGIEDLLEKILLEADLLELKANPNKLSSGSVIEASLDKGRGYVATVLVLSGTLNVGDFIVAGSSYGKIKAMYNHLGEKLTKVFPGEPVQILGLNGAPAAGETFREFDDEQDAKQVAYKRSQIEREQGIRTKKHITLDEIGRRLALGTFKELNIIIKGDVDGSVQALTDSLTKLSTQEIQINILHRAVGAITESDILLASASDAIIIGFQVRPSAQAKILAEKESIDIRHYSVIYQAIDEIRAAMEGMLEPTTEEKITGNLEIREIFKIPKVGTIAGCFVSEGKVYRNSNIRIVRDGIVVYTGKLASLKRYKDDVKEVVHGQDCGMNIDGYNDIQVNDTIEAFEEVEVKRTL